MPFRPYLRGPEGHLKKGRTATGYLLFEAPTKGEIRVAYRTDELEILVRGK